MRPRLNGAVAAAGTCVAAAQPQQSAPVTPAGAAAGFSLGAASPPRCPLVTAGASPMLMPNFGSQQLSAQATLGQGQAAAATPVAAPALGVPTGGAAAPTGEARDVVLMGAPATLTSPWPPDVVAPYDDDSDLFGQGEGGASHLLKQGGSPLQQQARGQLTQEERIPYRELQFVESLGSGEFGQVFRGFFQGTEVAIKQLYWDSSVLPEVIIQDLTKEIESFRHLRHKRLVSFVGACLEIPYLCLVTEYCPGGSLHHLLHVRKLRLPPLHGTNMCLQLADGVMYLHCQNPVVVHRDLKSLNVVLDLNLNLKLCDFGLTESMDRTHITKKNNGGSPRYMAPELFDNKSKITEKVDIWSAGCIFSEIFGGPLPYEGINTLADLTREMLVHRRIPAIPADIAEPIQNIIRSCYNFDGRLRPSARQVFDQLREAKRRLRAQGML